MILYQELQYSIPAPCPYIPEEKITQAYFFADELDENELDILLATGWRKFGCFYFRPVCFNCRKCIPIRIPVADFKLSKSQRRLLRKNSETVVEFGPLQYSDDIFKIYAEHCRVRFNREAKRDEFRESLCTISCPSVISKYYTNNILTGAGFLDRSSNALSSVYFVYKPDVSSLGLGNYSILHEIQYARDNGLLYYYIGYYVEGCSTMEYKSHFYPHERYDWINQQWEPVRLFMKENKESS